MSAAVAGGRRAATKEANRAAIIAAAREVFAELGFGAASVRDVVRRAGLAPGTFYNYFPDKEAVFRALVDDVTIRARERVRAGRIGATTFEAFVHGGFRAYFAFLAEDPVTFELTRRNAGTIRAMFDGAVLGAGAEELREDLDAAVAAGTVPPFDTELVAAAMVGAGIEVGVRMVERDPVDVDAAAAFATALFVGGVERLVR